VSSVEPILNKKEIADLLVAIKAGRVSVEPGENGHPHRRQYTVVTEVDLFSSPSLAQGSGETRIPYLDIILDSFARKFSTSLTNAMMRNFTVERTSIVSTDFQQSLLDLKNSGAVGIFSTHPLKHGCLFHFDTLLSFTLLEIMLGSASSSEMLALDRKLTTIEIILLKNTMTEVCTELQAAFKPVVKWDPILTKVENNFRLVNIVEPEIEVLVTTFNIRISGEQCGQMRFIIPYITLEPLREKFKALVAVAHAATNAWSDFLISETLEMESLVTARSGVITMPIRKILELQEGDIINLFYNPDQSLTIMVEDLPLFQAISGERNGKKAFHVTGRYSNRSGGTHGGN
jgi:flagellar motor switch protein FliM